jgi:hypothetical protein
VLLPAHRGVTHVLAIALGAAAAFGSPPSADSDEARGERVMISAVQAFERAHTALAGTPFHEAPGDVVITRDAERYTVLFAAPGKGSAGAGDDSATVLVDAESGSVLEIRKPEGLAGAASTGGARVSARSALDIGLKRLVESTLAYDPNWTTSALLKGGRYVVTFPIPERLRAMSEQPDFAIEVTIDARTGDIVDARSAG